MENNSEDFYDEIEPERTTEEIVDNIAYNKRIIRALEIIFVVMALGVIGFFIKMIAYGSTALDVISYTALLLACWKIWYDGREYEMSNFWDEVELMQKVNKKEKDEEIS